MDHEQPKRDDNEEEQQELLKSVITNKKHRSNNTDVFINMKSLTDNINHFSKTTNLINKLTMSSFFKTDESIKKLYAKINDLPFYLNNTANLKSYLNKIDSISAMFRPTENFKSSIFKINEMSSYFKNIESYNNTFNKLASIEDMVKPYEEIKKSYSKLNNISSFFENATKISRSFKKIESALELLDTNGTKAFYNSDYISKQLKNISDISRSFKTASSFSESLSAFNVEKSLITALDIAWDKTSTYFQNITEENVFKNDVNYFKEEIENRKTELLEIQQKIDTLIQREDPVPLLKLLLEVLNRNNSSVLKFMLIGVILPFILNIAAGLVTPIISEKLYRAPKQLFKIVKNDENIISNIDTSYCRIAARMLAVRTGKGKKFNKIGTLYLGQVVILIKRDRHWSLVKYVDPIGDVLIQGYVYNRYILKMN